MKFIKNGKEYAGIEQAYFAHCGIMAHCEKCGMQGKTAKNSDCRAYACNHPVEAAYLMGFELRESNMKKYAPERLGEYVHTIRVTLMQDDYTGHIAYEVGGNCKGGDLLDPNGVLEGDYLFTENDCRFRCVDEEMLYFEAMLHNAAGDALMVEGDENDMLNMIVSMEIADVRKVEQYESNP